jgi:hypothetical protein
LWTVARAKHNESVDIEPDEYARRTVQFFDRFLAGREDADNIFNAGRFETIARSEKAVERISASRVRPRTADREGIALDR